jgi:hypothetical protein
VLDAHDTLGQITRANVPDGPCFRNTISSIVRRLATSPAAGLRIYGEMVDILAESGHFDGARRLEELWNELGAEVPFALFCGYASAHFGDPRSAGALHAICRAHTHVHSKSEDDLGTFLVSQAAAHQSPEKGAAASLDRRR